MKWKIAVVSAVLALFTFGIPAPDAEAVGFGFYVGGGIGSGEFTYDLGDDVENYLEENSWWTEDWSKDLPMDMKHFGIGIHLDTKVAKPGLFNYRLNLGYEMMDSESEISGSGVNYSVEEKIDWKGVVLEQDFGFGGKAGEKVRIWVGPCIRLSYHSGDDESFEYEMVGYGIGPVLGVNYAVSSNTALTVRLGYLFNRYTGTFDPKEPYGYDGDFDLSEDRFFINLGVLFGGIM